MLLAILLSVLLSWSVRAQDTEEAIGPVFALRGTLSSVEGQNFDTLFTAADGSQDGIVGINPSVEGDITQLRSDGVPVKVWGIRYAAPTSDGYPLIVAESILPADATATPTATPTGTQPAPTPTPTSPPAAADPVAVVEAAAVNVRSGPGIDYSTIDTLTAGTTCPITGQNEDGDWWRLNCNNGVNGWVYGQLLALAGAVETVPVVGSPPPPTPVPSPTPPPSFANWRAEFYNNRNLSGEPVLLRDVANIDFDWGTGSPGGNVPANNFSARFERTLNFAYGNYAIQVRVDDGARLYLDNELVVDSWQLGAARDITVRRILSGNHTFRLEYFEATDNARIRLAINPISTSNQWDATYYAGRNLGGGSILSRREPGGGNYPLDFDWQQGSPAPGVVPVDNWSARWQGTFHFDGGDYRFLANSDDGVRVSIDGIRILDEWEDGFHNDVSNVFRALGAGNHQVTVDYYEATSGSYVRVWWEQLDD